ncbi:peroxiredoxin family protein [Psychroserpens luteus]|uniref:Peroxiredoxin family protein n=1 Tax=Psychroserpens luteus TaxID=1434066 RepID=A0ABW5ZNU2_9FLAO|nr:TlpA disulfide reductase family protein [Psychroserpens luteus]
MNTKSLILTLILAFTLNICLSQNNEKKSFSEEELAEMEANYKIKKEKDKADRKELDGTTLNELVIEDIDGNIHTLESLKGKVVLMNFWFIHCKPCVAEIPDLNELKTKFKDKDVVFLAVALDNKKSLDKFLELHPFDLTIIPKGRELAERFKIPHYPYNVILDKTGTLHYVSDVLSLNITNRLKRRINGFLR